MNADLKIVQPDDRLVCEECGRHGAIDLGDRKLCPDCYGTCGDCCSEFGREKEQTETDL